MRRRFAFGVAGALIAATLQSAPAIAQDETIPTARDAAGPQAPLLAPRRPARSPGPIPPDPFASLRDGESLPAKTWSVEQTGRTLALLKTDPRFASTLVETTATIRRRSDPSMVGAFLFELDQNAAHASGVWRRARMDDVLRGAPRWEDVLDLDALSKAEVRRWRWGGAVCEPTHARTCLVRLSDPQGTTLREVDLQTRATRSDVFRLPDGAAVAWIDDDTVLAAAPGGGGTGSLLLKRLRRGQAYAAAAEQFRLEGRPASDRLIPLVLDDGEGRRLNAAVVERAGRAVDLYVEVQGAYRKFPVPADFVVVGLVGGRLVLQLREGWTAPEYAIRLGRGQLLSFDYRQIVERQKELTPTPILSMMGEPYVLQVGRTRNGVFVRVRENDRVRVYLCTPGRMGWSVRAAPLPDDAFVTGVTASPASDISLIGVERFPDVDSLWTLNAAGAVNEITPPQDKRHPVERPTRQALTASARDGARIAYIAATSKSPAAGAPGPALVLARSDIDQTLDPSEVDLGRAWMARGGLVAVVQARDRNFDVRNAPLRVSLAYNDLGSLAQDLARRRLADPARIALAGAGGSGLIAAISGERQRRLWSGVALVDPFADPLRPEPSRRQDLAERYGDTRATSVRRFWDETSPYETVKLGVHYAPTLLLHAGEATDDDGRRLSARLSQAGAPALFEDADLAAANASGWAPAILAASEATFLGTTVHAPGR